MSDDITELKRRLDRLEKNQKELDARLWVIEDSRTFRILQRIGIASSAVRTRIRQLVNPGAEAAEKERAYQAWLNRHPLPEGDLASLSYRPKLKVGADADTDADYIVFLGPDGKLTPNALYDLSAALQNERYEVLYGDEDHGSAPLLKPDWSPELLASPEYLGRFLVVRRDAVESAGDFRDGIGLARRLAEKRARFRHVPKILATTRGAPMKSTPANPRNALGSPLVSIVVCSRDAKLLESCLRGIDGRTSYKNREIVIVEHNLNRPVAGHTVTHVPYSGVFDFAAMNNLGAKSAKGEILLFLNDDVQPLNETWLEALVAQAQRPEVGAVGALLLYPNGSIQHSGIALGIHGYAGHPGRGTFDGGFWPWVFVTRNVSAVTGACLAIRRELFEKLGGFDTKFPVNYNDVDLCLRAGQAGYQVILEAAARLTHYESRTRRRGVAWEERELFAERWGGHIARGDPYYNPNLTLNSEDCRLAD